MIQKRWVLKIFRGDLEDQYIVSEIDITGEMVDGLFVPKDDQPTSFATQDELIETKLAEARADLVAVKKIVASGMRDRKASTEAMKRLDRADGITEALMRLQDSKEHRAAQETDPASWMLRKGN